MAETMGNEACRVKRLDRHSRATSELMREAMDLIAPE
jgi:hypothetical protein